MFWLIGSRLTYIRTFRIGWFFDADRGLAQRSSGVSAHMGPLIHIQCVDANYWQFPAGLCESEGFLRLFRLHIFVKCKCLNNCHSAKQEGQEKEET